MAFSKKLNFNIIKNALFKYLVWEKSKASKQKEHTSLEECSEIREPLSLCTPSSAQNWVCGCENCLPRTLGARFESLLENPFFCRKIDVEANFHLKSWQKRWSHCSKVEIFSEQTEVAFLPPSKICKNLNLCTEIQIFANFAG